jgi:hypothetical protein
MNGDESRGRLELIERTFRALAACTREIIESELEVDGKAISSALGSIGSRLLSAERRGPKWEQVQLGHVTKHAHEETKEMIRAGRSKGIITEQHVQFAFRSAPPPEL